tara:strand:- start:2245 stop:2529 length:285 start_codon:yes stop_codon:yes gene_type:complete
MPNTPTFILEPYLVTTDPTTGKQLSGNRSVVKKQIRANRKAARKTARKARKDGLVDRTEGTVNRKPLELPPFTVTFKKPRSPGPTTKRRTAASR